MRPKSYKATKIKRMLYAYETNHNSPKHKRVCREFFKHFKDSQYMQGEVSTTNIDMMIKVSARLKGREIGFVEIKPITCISTKDPNQIPFRVVLYFNGVMTMEIGRACAAIQSIDVLDQVTALMDSQDIPSKVARIEDEHNWYECGRRCGIQDIQDILTSILCGYSDAQIAYIMGVIIWWGTVICKQGTVKFAGVDTCSLTDRCHYYSTSQSILSMTRVLFSHCSDFASHLRIMLKDPANIAEYFGLVRDGDSYKAVPEMDAPIYNTADPLEPN